MKRFFPLALAVCGVWAAGMSSMAQTSAPQTYVLSPDDQIAISVLGHDDLKETVTILPDGTCRYPIVGSIHAAGMTVDGLAAWLTRHLSDELNSPEVTVTVVQSRPQQVSVLGAVKTSGEYDVRPGTHILDVLAEAGGPAQDPALTQATLVSGDGRKSTPIDVSGLLNGTAPSQNLPVEAGDVLLVQARDASFAQAQVLGEALHPGVVAVPPDGLPITSVLALAGGPTPQAALTEAQILHAGHAQTINLRPLLSDLNDPAGQARVMPGDALLIPANNERIAVLGEVRSPAIYSIPDGGSLSAVAALAEAGGAADGADLKNARILRRDSEGKATMRKVNLEALMKGDPNAKDVALEPGDIVYVPARHQGGNLNPDSLLSLIPLVSVLYR